MVTVRAMARERRAVEAISVREAPWCAYEVGCIGEQQIAMCYENGVADDGCADRSGSQSRQHTAAAKRVTHLLKKPYFCLPRVFHWWSARALVKATWDPSSLTVCARSSSASRQTAGTGSPAATDAPCTPSAGGASSQNSSTRFPRPSAPRSSSNSPLLSIDTIMLRSITHICAIKRIISWDHSCLSLFNIPQRPCRHPRSRSTSFRTATC